MVHVGAVDAPVTRADVNTIAAEVWKAAGKGPNAPEKPAVDILGWEFALEVNETMKEVTAQARVNAAFKKIPREVLEKKAVEQGDVHFFELGALKVESKIKKRELTLTLSNFIIPLDDVPAEVRSAIKHWSQMVDYWAVDWDYKDDTFHNQWQSYRTRKNPKLELSVKASSALRLLHRLRRLWHEPAFLLPRLCRAGFSGPALVNRNQGHGMSRGLAERCVGRELV